MIGPFPIRNVKTKTFKETSEATLDSDIATFVGTTLTGQEQLLDVHYAAAYNGTTIVYTAMIIYTV